MEIFGGFLIGFLGSFHCIGMCGPIVLALPSKPNSALEIVAGRLLYNFGRIATYSFLGAILGLFGQRLVLIGLQQYASIALGVTIIVSVFAPEVLKTKIRSTKTYSLFNDLVKMAFSKLTKDGGASSLFIFGIVNGFLPCGFVYVALAGALTSGSVISGILFMALFGLGTTPVMFLTSILGNLITLNVRRKINKLIPVLAVLLAIIFILRGLNLGIPYLSPKFSEKGKIEHVMKH
ncbi:MAG: sulfite exporter TauE/SafE family protein [Bacteroidetes bacterium]|nr:sulfite exporter TauE/SafE family protein [Bacteroidota bacterium]MBU1680244.1 sulfite exporter TauE/SafE family protein [Bacteroidota bacterium]MBU2508457.1 sulfite exporter TauE/SafE family protein [Bacteroidota bacterium]